MTVRQSLIQAGMWFRAAVILASFFYPVWFLHVEYFSHRWQERPLSLAASFLTVQAAVILCQLLTSCALKRVALAREMRSRRVRPHLLKELAAYAAGDGQLAGIRTLERRYPADFDRTLERLLSLVSGEGRERLTALAEQLRLVRRWERWARRAPERERRHALECLGLLAGEYGGPALRRLARRSTPLVEASACRLLARSPRQEDAAWVFSLIVGKPYLVRVLLAGEMRRHARDLCQTALPAEAASGDTTRLLAALELAESWRKALRLPFLEQLMRHPSAAVRARALRLTPFAAEGQDVERYVRRALESDSEQVQAAALSAAAAFRAPSLLPLIERLASGGSGELARLACTALAHCGPDGAEILRRLLLEGGALPAARAAEALSAAAGPSPGLEPA